MNELMPRQTLQALADNHAAVAALVEEGFRKLGEAKRIMRAAIGSQNDNLFHDRISDYDLEKPDAPRSAMNESLTTIQETFWRCTLQQSGIREMMGPEDRDRMDKLFKDHATPAFTEENLLATLQGLYESREDIARACVESCYRRLRPCRWDRQHKTNSPWKVGPKVILERVFGLYSWVERQDLLSDLDKVFHMLDGKGFPEYPNDFVTAVKGALRSKESAFETDYFDCRAYFKTGTLHVKFKRPDLVTRFNQIGAGESNNLGGE
ncbi:MAG: DUF4942 domain-containing protein [Desulfovibrio sp.]